MIPTTEVQGNLVSFLQYLMLSYFSSNSSYCTVIYYDRHISDAQNECDTYCSFMVAVELALLQKDQERFAVMWIAAEQDVESYLEDAIEHGCQSYIVITRYVMNYLQLKLDIKERTLQRIRDRNFLIFYENSTMLDKSWFTREALKMYPNLWFIVPSGNSNYDLYTQNYSISNTAEVQLVESYNVIENKFVGDGNVFYDKMFDLQRRDVAMGVADYVPYCMTSNVGENKGNIDAFNSSSPKELFLEGIEGTLIVEFCRIRNCNIKLWDFGPSGWGDIYDNGTGYGEVYSTYSKQTEFATCCVYYDWYFHLMDGSQYICKSTVILLVPGAKLRPMFLTLIYPFAKTLWLSVGLMLVVMTFVHHMITSLNLKHSMDRDSAQPPIEKSIFDMISIYLDQGIFPNSISSSYRVLISFILLSGVVLSNSYAGGLASVLTVPRYEKSIETVHDYVLSPYRWAAPAVAWIFALFGAESYDIRTVVERFDEVPDENEMFRRSLPGDYAIGVELLNGGNFAYGKSVRDENVGTFDIMKEILYFAYTIGYSQRGWPLMEYFNKFNLEAISHGFIIVWERQAIRKYTSTRMQQALIQISEGHKDEEEKKPLTTEHVLGPMIVLMIGLLAALTIFLGELAWHKLSIRIQKRQSKIFTDKTM
ncbi:uncharacterized protein LOC131690606 [Topomyia yanbarensis]|uniref:uncharacterized protein LOC131690606 n=1 Tax=Topomyia yanbarensis TaxID=2498891 RepID=UPI00273C1A96|nr:uncharacterized protein LOC131690606 [Topomyia yanbarensis]